uniref:PDZ domain-containing protein n=1 Tax=Strigamia maritima TaxID=126957 RepID=T1JGG1_STRMM
MRATYHLPASISRSWNPTGGREEDRGQMSTWTLEGTSFATGEQQEQQEQQKSTMAKFRESFIGRAGDKPLKKDPTAGLTQEERMTIRRVEQRFARESDSANKSNRGKPCRICLKRLRHKDVFIICCECQRYVCDDCGCYPSKDYPGGVACSICYRKKLPHQNRVPIKSPSPPFSPTEQLGTPVLDIPMQQLSLVHSLPQKRSWEPRFSRPIELDQVPVVQEPRTYKFPQVRTPSQEEEEVEPEVHKEQRRPSFVRSDSRAGIGSRTSTQDEDMTQDFLIVPEPEFFTTRRLSDTGPSRIPIPEQPRRLSDTGPDRGRLIPQADQERRLSEFLATWTGKIPMDRRLSDAGAAIWRERTQAHLAGRRMSEAGWNKKPLELNKKQIEHLEKRSLEANRRDGKRQLDVGRNKWSLDSGLCPPTEQKDRRLSEGLAAPSRDRERRASDVGPSRSDDRLPTMSHALSDSLQDPELHSPPNGSSASESSGAEDYYQDSGRRKSKKVKKKTKIQRQRSSNYGLDPRPIRQTWKDATNPQESGRRVSRQVLKERDGWRRSSGSSELSDNGPEMTGPPPIPPRRDSQPQIPHFYSRQRSIHKQMPTILIHKSDTRGPGDSSLSPEYVAGRITTARRMSRGDPRNVYSDCEPMHEEIDTEIMELRKPRRSWPEVDNEIQLKQGNSTILDALRSKAPAGIYDTPRTTGDSYGDYEPIQIVVHDVDNVENRAQIRTLILHRGVEDVHRTCGLGMRIVGGKTSSNGHLFTYVAETMPGGPAEIIGIEAGDSILAWDGHSLVDRTFEEVNDIIDQSGDVIELMVEHSTRWNTSHVTKVAREFRATTHSTSRAGVFEWA